MNNAISKLIALSLILFSLNSFAQSGNWFVLKSSESAYQIEFPKEPVQRTQVVNSALGELKMDIYMYDASQGGNDDNLVYMVNYSEYPEDAVHSDNTELLKDFFEGAVNGAVTNVRGKLLSEKIIKLGDYPGREIKIDFQDGMAVIRVRMYLVENKLYLIQTITETQKDFNKSITRFMDSFKLIE